MNEYDEALDYIDQQVLLIILELLKSDPPLEETDSFFELLIENYSDLPPNLQQLILLEVPKTEVWAPFLLGLPHGTKQ